MYVKKYNYPATLTSYIVWTVNLLDQQLNQLFSLIFCPSMNPALYEFTWLTWKHNNTMYSLKKEWSFNRLWYFKLLYSFVQGFGFYYCENDTETVSRVLLRDYFVVGYLKLREGKSEIVLSLVGGLYGHLKPYVLWKIPHLSLARV